MVLTAAQTAAFFQNAGQMGIPAATVAQLGNEGIDAVSDLADFDKTSLQQLADNLRRPGGRVPDPNPNAAAGATSPTPSFVFGAKSQKRLQVVCDDLVRYYQAVGRPLTAANLQWTHVMKNFEIQWKALKDRKDNDEPEVPKVTKALPIIKWSEAFNDFSNRAIGVCHSIPLAYVIRAEVDVSAAAPALMQHQPHSELYGSVEAELVGRASHDHPLYRDDNATVYYNLEEATRGTAYAASIKPYQRAKDGRGAFLALTSQYAGKDKWEAKLKRQDQLLHTRIWKGQSNFSLEHFISQHRNAYVSMEAASAHVDFQLPNDHTRVGYLLEAIQTSDAGLQAAMASVQTDNGVDGMRNNFEAAVAHLMPYDPVAKKRSNKRGGGEISDVDVSSITGNATKPSIGETGVHFRYYKKPEYKKLTEEQKDELREWRKANPDSHKRKNGGKGSKQGQSKKARFTKKQVAAMVAEQVEQRLSEAKEPTTKDDPDTEKYIMSMVEAALAKKAVHSVERAVAAIDISAPAATKKVTLQGILRQARNASK